MAKKRGSGFYSGYTGTGIPAFTAAKSERFNKAFTPIEESKNYEAIQQVLDEEDKLRAQQETEEDALVEQLNKKAEEEALAPSNAIEAEAKATFQPDQYKGLKDITARIQELEDLNLPGKREREYKKATEDTNLFEHPLDYLKEAVIGKAYGAAEFVSHNSSYMTPKQLQELEQLRAKKNTIVRPIVEARLKRNDELVKRIEKEAERWGTFGVGYEARNLQTANNLAWTERDELESVLDEKNNIFNGFFGHTGNKIKSLLSVGIIPAIDQFKVANVMEKHRAGEPLTESEQLILQAGVYKQDTQKSLGEKKFFSQLGEGLETSVELGAGMGMTSGITKGAKAAALEAFNVGAANSFRNLAVKGAIGTVDLGAQVAMSPFTYNTYAQKFTSPMVVTHDAEGKEVILTSKEQKKAFENQSSKATAKLTEQLNRLQKAGQGKSKEATEIQEQLNQIFDDVNKIYEVDEKGNSTGEIGEDVTKWNAAVYAGTESAKEIFSEMFVGHAAGRIGHAAKMKVVGTKLEAFTNGVGKILDKVPSIATTKVGKITSALGYHTNFNEVFQSVPEEFVEEFFTGVVPTYNAEKGEYNIKDYYQQLEQFKDPNFYAQIAASTILMGGLPATYAAARHHVEYKNDADYKKAYDAQKKSMEDLGAFYNTLDKATTDKDVVEAITMRAGNTLYSVPQYEGKIADLRNKGKESEAKALEGMAFQNLAAQALRTNSIDEFELAMKRMTKNGGLHSDTVANAQEALSTTIPALKEVDFRYKERPNYEAIQKLSINDQIHSVDIKHYRESIAKTQKEINDKVDKLKEQGHVPASFDVNAHMLNKELEVIPYVIEAGPIEKIPSIVSSVVGEDIDRLVELEAGLATTNEHALQNAKDLAYQTNKKNLPAIKAEMRKEKVMQAIQEALSATDSNTVQKSLEATVELAPNEVLVGDEIVIDEEGKKGLKVHNTDTDEIRIIELTPETEKIVAKADELALAEQIPPDPLKEEEVVPEPEQLEEYTADDAEINAILSAQGIEITANPDDFVDLQFSRHGDQSGRVKELVDRVVDEIAEKQGKDKGDVNFEDFINNFLKKFGTQTAQSLFDKYQGAWESTGRDSGNVEDVYDKLFGASELLTDLLMGEDVVKPIQKVIEQKVQDTVTEVQTITAKKVDYNPNGEATLIDTDPNNEDRRTALPDLKFGFNFQKVKRNADGTFTVISDTLKTEGLIDNNFILDHSLLRELEENGTPLNVVEMDIDTVPVMSIDSEGNKTTMSWGEYKSKKNVQPGSDLWASMVPMVITHTTASGRTVPLAQVHSPNWYRDENITDKLSIEEKNAAIEKGFNESLNLRKNVIANKAKGVFTTVQISSSHFGQIDNLKQHSDNTPKAISEATGDSTVAVVKRVKGQIELHTEKGVKFNGKISTQLDVKDKNGNPIFEEGAIIDIRPAYTDENGDMVYMPLLTMNNSPIAPEGNLKKDLSPTIENTVRAATLASIILNNQGNAELLKKLEAYGMTLGKAVEIADKIKADTGIDLKQGSGGTKGLASFVGLFTRTNYGDFTLDSSIIKKQPGYTYFSDMFKKKTGEVVSNAKVLQISHQRIGSPMAISFGIGGNIGTSSIDALLSNIDNLFSKDSGIFRQTQFNVNMENLGTKTTVPIFDENGTHIESKNYNDVVKDNLRTNILSHEIETVNGEKKWVIDIQPMIYMQQTKEVGAQLPTATEANKEALKPAAVATVKVAEQLEQAPTTDFIGSVKQLNENLNEEQRAYLNNILNNLNTDDVHESRWKLTAEQQTIIAGLKSNNIVGITAEQNKELIGSLKHMVINSLDFSKAISSVDIKKAIESSVQDHLVPTQNNNNALIKALQGMPESALNNTDAKGRSLAKVLEKLVADSATMETILSQSEKITSTKKNDLGSLAAEFNNLFNTNFEEEDLESGDNTSGDDGHSTSFLEKEMKLSYSVGLKLSLFGIPMTENNGSTKTTFMNTPKSHGADDVYSILVDIMSTIPSDWNALMSVLDDRYKNRNKEVYLQIKEKLAALPVNYQNEFLHKTISKKLTIQKVMVTETFDSQSGESLGFSVRVIDENSSKEDIRWVNKIKGDFTSSPFASVDEDFDVVLNTEYAKKIKGKLDGLVNKKELTFEETRDIFNNIGLKLISDNTVQKVIELGGVVGSRGILKHVYGQLHNLIEASEKNKGKVLLSNPVNNLFATSGSALKTIVDTEVMLNGNYVARAIRVNGKTMQGTIPNTAIYDTVQDLKDTTKSPLFNAMRQAALTSRNYVLNLLTRDADFNESFGVDFSSPDALRYQNNDSYGDTDFDKIAEQDNIVTTLGVYTNKFGNKTMKTHSPVEGLNFRIGQMTTGTLADKGRMLYLKTALLNLNGDDMTFDSAGNISLKGVLGNFLAEQLFESELDRILETYDRERTRSASGIKEYDTTAKLFLALPSLNAITIKDKKGVDRNIHEYLTNEAYTKEALVSSGVLDQFREQAVNKITDYVNSEIDTKITADGKDGDFIKFGIYNPKAGERQSRIQGLDAEYLYGKKFEKNVQASGDGLADMQRKDAAQLRYLMAEYAINNILNLNNVHQLFLGDIAYYSKGGRIKGLAFTDGKIDPKKISNPAIYSQILEGIGVIIDKRAASLIAPGLKLANSDSPVFSEATHHMHIAVNDVESMSSIMKELVQAQFGLNEVENQAYDAVVKANENIRKLSDELSNSYLEDHERPERIKEIKSEIAKNENIRKTAINGPLEGLKDYFNITGTDAQEYSTWQAHIDMLNRQGKLLPEEKELLKSAYAKLERGEEVNAKELKTLMQPVKPVYTGLVPENGIIRPVYIKSSSFPLLPQLTKNLKLDKVRQALEHIERTEGKMTRLTYQTANKIGAKDTKLTMEDMYTKSLGELYSTKDGVKTGAMASAASLLPTKNFKIQQETPSKEYKAYKEGKDPKITMGSQFFKIILGNGINKISRAVFPNLFGNDFLKSLGIADATHLTGEQLDQVYFKAYSEYSDTILKSLNSELGLSNDKDFYSLNAAGQNRIITNLEQIIKKEVTERGYPTYLKDASALTDDEGILKTEMPLMFDSNAHKFESLLQSIISSRLITHKLPGNSHISASSEGFERVASLEEVTNRHGVIWLDGRKEGELKSSYITDKDGKKVLVESEVAIKSHWKTTDKDGKTTYVNLASDEYSKNIIDDHGKVVGRELLTDKIDPELLSHFSFRIPTSSHQSGVVLKVAAFLPEECGDLLIVPKEHTVQLGEDYDIDKRYIYKSNYFVDSKTGQVKKVRYEDLQANIAAINKVLGMDNPTIEDLQKAVPLSVLGELGYSLVDGDIDPNVEGQETPVLKVGARAIDKLKIKMLENVLIDVYKSVYQSPDAEVQQKIFKPLITDVAEEAANYMDKKLNSGKDKKNFSIFSDNYQRYLLKLGANGKGGIGVHSNAVTLQAQFQRLSETQKIKVRNVITNAEGQTFMSDFEEMIGPDNNSQGWMGKDDKAMFGGRDVADQHAENQNVSTDNINKQIMVKRNENSHTMSVYAFMAYLGYDKTPLIGFENSNGELMTFATEFDRKKAAFEMFKQEGIPNEKMAKAYENRSKDSIHLPSIFMNQPILRDYVEMKEAASSMTATYSSTLEEDILKDLSKKYGFDIEESAMGNISTTDFIAPSEYERRSKEMTGNKLWENLSTDTAEADVQAAVLQKFLRFQQKASELSKYQQAVNLSTSKLGVSYFEVMQRIETLDEMARDTSFENIHQLVGDFKPADTLQNSFGVIPDATLKSMTAEGYTLVGENFWKPTTIEGKMLINSLKAANNLLPIYFPYQNANIKKMLLSIFNIKGADFAKKSATTLKLKYKIMSSLNDFVSAGAGFTEGNLTSDKNRIFKDSSNNKSLASILQFLKERKHPVTANALVKDLEPKLNVGASGVSLIQHIADSSTTFDKNSKYEAFVELLQSDEVLGEFNGEQYTTSMLAQDLATYAFLVDNENGATGFKQFISVDYMKTIGVTKNYRGTLKNILDGNSATMLENFVTQYVQHNPETATTLTMKNSKEYAFEPIVGQLDAPSTLEEFRVSGANIGGFLTIKDGSIKTSTKPYRLYKYNKETGTFQKIDVLGTRGFNEYNPQETQVKSVLEGPQYVNTKGVRFQEIGGKTFLTLPGGQLMNVSAESLIPADKGVEGILQQIYDSPHTAEHLPEYKAIIEELQEYVKTGVKVEYGPTSGGALGQYNRNTDIITISPNIMKQSIIDKDGNITEAMKQVKEIILEEVIHSMTVKEFNKYVKSINSFQEVTLVDDAPEFAKRLVALYAVAKSSIPYNPNDPSTYYSKDIYEFMAGAFVAKDYRAKLDEANPGFMNKFKQMLRSLFNLLHQGEPLTYKSEIYKAINEMLKTEKELNPENKGVKVATGPSTFQTLLANDTAVVPIKVKRVENTRTEDANEVPLQDEIFDDEDCNGEVPF